MRSTDFRNEKNAKLSGAGGLRLMVKLNEGVSGLGNAVLQLPPLTPGLDRRSEIEKALRAIQPVGAAKEGEKFLGRMREDGGIVEVMLAAKTSPSGQALIHPDGRIEVLSTHEQILDEKTKQIFVGAKFPADQRRHRQAIADSVTKVGHHLHEKGVVGFFAVDFVSDAEGRELFAIEINLRQGGTTHARQMAEFALGAKFDPQSGWLVAGGRPVSYVSSDNVHLSNLTGVETQTVVDVLAARGLLVSSRPGQGTGVMLTMAPLAKEIGKLGLIAYGRSAKEAQALFDDAKAALAQIGKQDSMKRAFFFFACLSLASWVMMANAHAVKTLDVPGGVSVPHPTQKVTDFNKEGNEDVADRYHAFLKRPERCEFRGPGRRVLLTGFGLFAGVPFNISGALIENFARMDVWPENVITSAGPIALKPGLELKQGRLEDSSGGVKVVNRRLRIDGADYNFCLVLLDVLWDFAGAVIAAEMERFQPDLVVMSGRGSEGVIVESAAKNTAIPLSGFKSSGDQDANNTPTSDAINTGASPDLIVEMTWDNKALARRIAPRVKALGYETHAPDAWRPGNDYICNNLSFITLHAARGTRFDLAGGLVHVQPVLPSQPQIGFVHLPAAATLDPQTLPQWVQVYASLIDQAFAN